MRLRGILAGCVVALALFAAATSCSQKQGGGFVALATSSTLASSGDLSDPNLSEDDPAKPTGSTPEQIQAKFDSAIAARDFCAVLDAMNTSLPDVEDGQAVVETYRNVAKSLEKATPFVPPELDETWKAVVIATQNGAKAAERTGGAIDDPALQAAFATSDFESASVRLDLYSDASCSGAAG